MKVLILEDDASLSAQLSKLLEHEGFEVFANSKGDEGLHVGLEYTVDLAVVDVGLPNLDGIEVIRRWRQLGRDFPVLVLTARGKWQEKVLGLEAGADDYVVKPASAQELLARIRALLRRSRRVISHTLNFGAILVDTRSHRVTVHSQEVSLTAFEYRVLEYLTLHAGEVVSKAQLFDHVYAHDEDRDSNTIEVFIRRLRAKLDPDGRLNPIETLRGQGYRFSLLRQI